MPLVDANGRERYAHEAELELGAGIDPAAVGAQVTVALCGHWKHEGPCRWPNNHEFAGGIYRTLFVAPPTEEAEVRGRIEAALRGDDRWTVVSSGGRPVAAGEQELADRLAETPLP
jgi:hypothetical protein